MNPRQRVLATLEGKQTDRLAVDLWYTSEVHDALIAHTGTTNEVDMWRALGIDKMAWVGPGYKGETAPLAPGAESVTPWGTQLKRVVSGSSTYLEQMIYPLAELEEPEELDDFPWWPDPEAFDLEPVLDRLNEVGDEFVTLGPWISIFEIYCQMRGLEEGMIDLLANPEFVTAALDRIESIQSRLLERIFKAGTRRPDLVFISDDMGSQHNLLMSLATWDEHIGPRLTRWCDLIHQNGSRVFYHTDGAVKPLLGRLVDAGIDVLNPLQHRCPGMNLDDLARDFGSRVTFHGGVDTQQVLPFGTPEDV
ncbi:MAG: hypothetical protein JJU11_11790, partial [Candidatus Sumerlaeia bacterium]|nr:hypothetical protein [Candidatus Sumerlaeia bacterium]